MAVLCAVSVPLRGKEGAGPSCRIPGPFAGPACAFPSPCGVRRVRDYSTPESLCYSGVVSVSLRGKEGAGRVVMSAAALRNMKFPSPCGVRRVRDTPGTKYPVMPALSQFPSPCGVRRVRDLNAYVAVGDELLTGFRPLAG